jgi:hypothetical protein
MAAKVSYEADNGSAWKLDAKPTVMTGSYTGYADAGIVYDLGPASQFNGITYTGTGNLVANVWIGDDPQAYTPGEHPFATDPVNFSYGFQQADGTYWMTSGPEAGHTLTAADIQKDFPGAEAYAWVGISGSAPQSGHVDAIPGVHNAANLTLTVSGDQVTASAR